MHINYNFFRVFWLLRKPIFNLYRFFARFVWLFRSNWYSFFFCCVQFLYFWRPTALIQLEQQKLEDCREHILWHKWKRKYIYWSNTRHGDVGARVKNTVMKMLWPCDWWNIANTDITSGKIYMNTHYISILPYAHLATWLTEDSFWCKYIFLCRYLSKESNGPYKKRQCNLVITQKSFKKIFHVR